MRWLTMTPTQRWHAHHGTASTGHRYQGRYKSFPVQSDEHLLTVCRYVERNAVRANLVPRAEEWKWGSLRARRAEDGVERPTLTSRPIKRPRDLDGAGKPAAGPKEEAILRSMHRGQPFDSEWWEGKVAAGLGLESLLRPRGGPRKQPNNGSRPVCALPGIVAPAPRRTTKTTEQRLLIPLCLSTDPDTYVPFLTSLCASLSLWSIRSFFFSFRKSTEHPLQRLSACLYLTRATTHAKRLAERLCPSESVEYLR